MLYTFTQAFSFSALFVNNFNLNLNTFVEGTCLQHMWTIYDGYGSFMTMINKVDN